MSVGKIRAYSSGKGKETMTEQSEKLRVAKIKMPANPEKLLYKM